MWGHWLVIQNYASIPSELVVALYGQCGNWQLLLFGYWMGAVNGKFM